MPVWARLLDAIDRHGARRDGDGRRDPRLGAARGRARG